VLETYEHKGQGLHPTTGLAVIRLQMAATATPTATATPDSHGYPDRDGDGYSNRHRRQLRRRLVRPRQLPQHQPRTAAAADTTGTLARLLLLLLRGEGGSR
jgi:hypothetical protein